MKGTDMTAAVRDWMIDNPLNWIERRLVRWGYRADSCSRRAWRRWASGRLLNAACRIDRLACCLADEDDHT